MKKQVQPLTEMQKLEAFYELQQAIIREICVAALERNATDGAGNNELAVRAGLHPSRVSRILHGKIENLTTKTIAQLAAALEYRPVFRMEDTRNLPTCNEYFDECYHEPKAHFSPEAETATRHSSTYRVEAQVDQ